MRASSGVVYDPQATTNASACSACARPSARAHVHALHRAAYHLQPHDLVAEQQLRASACVKMRASPCSSVGV